MMNRNLRRVNVFLAPIYFLCVTKHFFHTFQNFYLENSSKNASSYFEHSIEGSIHLILEDSRKRSTISQNYHSKDLQEIAKIQSVIPDIDELDQIKPEHRIEASLREDLVQRDLEEDNLYNEKNFSR